MRLQIGALMLGLALVAGGCAAASNSGSAEGQAFPRTLEVVKKCEREAGRFHAPQVGHDYSGRETIAMDIHRMIERRCLVESP